MDQHGGYEDLHGSGHQSVIPYVHRRTEVLLLKPTLPEPAFFSSPVKRRLSEPFIAQHRTVTLRPGARQIVSRSLKPYTTSIIIMASSSK
jgi:hypothetical protein